MPLDIPVNKDYHLTSDSFNIILKQRRVVDPTKAPNWEELKKKGASPEPRDTWKEIGYYKKIEYAMNAIVDKTILESNAESIPELLEEIRKIRREISAVLNGQY